MDEIPSKNLYAFLKKGRLLTYKRREIILHAQDTPSGVFYLNSGYVRLYSLSTEGEELTLIIFKPHDVFPLMWAFSNIPNTYTLEALTDVEIFRVSKNSLLEFIKSNPQELYTLTNNILIRMEGLFTRMEYLAFGSAYTKVASLLVICVERFGKKKGKSVIVLVPITHKDIASLIGMTRETVSLEMKKLEKKEIIGYKNRLLKIYSLKRLKKEAENP